MHPDPSTNTYSRAQQATQALASALSNPYQYSSHYAQAYHTQQQASSSSNPSMTTPGGYSLSSAYVPPPPAQPLPSRPGKQISRGTYGSRPARGGGNGFNRRNGSHQQTTHWYEPGNCRCTHGQCSFMGSSKSVEVHMMDRHLVFLPGWDKRKRKNDWDADPSLKGKQIPIQGTNIHLDTPEAIEAWIADRKKRWPTADRVQEKEKKLKEAVERGEISVNGPLMRGHKRPRQDDSRGQFRGRGRGRGGGPGGAQPSRAVMVHPLPNKPVAVVPSKQNDSPDDDEASSAGSDMDPEKDAIPSKPPPVHVGIVMEVEETVSEESKAVTLQPLEPAVRRPTRLPKPAPSQRNPFGNHPPLLRNLLLPEIRKTVSNLSQAIHFLVENDFLQDVELNPGEADSKLIEVISGTNNEVV